MADSNEVVFRVGLDGRGGLLPSADPAPIRWTHYRLGEDRTEPLVDARRIAEPIAEALVVGNARPRASVLEDGVLVVLRGVNCNPGADPEDMVSVRAWVDGERIVTVSPRRVFAIEDVHGALVGGSGPVTASGVLAAIVDALVDRMRPVVDGLEETVDDLYGQMLRGELDQLQRNLSDLRHTVTLLRRHMAPQRDALVQLHRMATPVLQDDDRTVLREAADRQIRYVEDLGAVRELAHVLQDELSTTLTDKLNRNMYVLSVVAAVFLPLGLLTGLLGINVGGMPGVDSSFAFWTVCGGLVLLAVFEVWFLRRRQLL